MAYLSYSWDAELWMLRGPSGHPFDVLTASPREQVPLECPHCGRALGPHSLKGLVKRQREGRPLIVG